MSDKDRWEFYKDRKGDNRWRRIAVNGRKVGASSQGYTKPADCKKNAERNGCNGNPKNLGSTDKWEFYQNKKGEHRWRRRSRNKEIVGASSEGYSNRRAMLANARRHGWAG